jgi:Putative DNA-binding domain
LPGLADLQHGFAEAVRGVAPASGNLGIDDRGLAAERRIAIYRNHHRISLAGALAANFPTVAALLGTRVFDGLALDFIAALPPAEACLGAYGAGLAAFIEKESRLAALPYIADAARLDWALNEAERADDVPVFGPSDLSRLGADALGELRLTGHPSLSLLRSPYPLLRIRDVARGGEGVSLEEGGVSLMVWRRDCTADCSALDADTYRFIKAMSAGEPLDIAGGALASERLAEILARYVLTGAFVAPAP